MGVCRYRLKYISLSVQVDFSQVSTTNGWYLKFNMRRYIPFVQATMYYFVCYTDMDNDISTDFQRFSKNCLKAKQTFSGNFHRLPNISYFRIGQDISDTWHTFTSEDMENMPPDYQMWFLMNFISGVFPVKTLMSILIKIIITGIHIRSCLVVWGD